MNNEQRVAKALEYKHNGYNCCQSIVLAFEDIIKNDIDILLKISSGFGLGAGGMNNSCGACNGAIIVSSYLTDGKGSSRYSKKVLELFVEKSGALICKDLKGIETGKILCSCDDCVKNAVLSVCETFNLSETVLPTV